MLHRLRKPLLLGVITLILLEVTLQVTALGFWWLNAPDPQPTSSEGVVVLCVGDSFTFGAGASTPDASYPAQLDRLCKERLGGDWQVVNGGWGGQDSRDVLEKIDGQLARYRPEIVCVVIGCNDRWSRPTELRLPATPQSSELGFRWELRTLRLLQLLRSFGSFHDEPAEEREPELGNAPALVGSWSGSRGIRTLVLAADGSCRLDGRAHQWRGDGRRLSIRGPKLHLEFTTERQQDRWVLRLVKHGAAAEPIVLTPSNAQPLDDVPSDERGDLAVFRGDWPEAERAYQEGRASAIRGAEAWVTHTVGLLRTYFETDRVDAARDLFRELHAAYQEHPRESTLAALVRAAKILRDQAEIQRLAEAGITRFPDNDTFWIEHATSMFWIGEVEDALASVNRALEKVRVGDGRRRMLWKLRADLAAQSDAESLAESLVLAWREIGSPDFLEQLMAAHSAKLDEPELAAACEASGASEPERQALLEAHRKHRDTGHHSGVLRAHLQQMVERIRGAGARPILASYPFRDAELENTLSSTAAALAVPFARVSTLFQDAVRDDPERTLFVTDGHCNDDGYGLMAEALFRVLRDEQ